jgi:predicted nuclease of predicted toxin-antitoxin system
MLIKLLLDQGLPRSASKLLSQAGIDTIHVAEIGFSTAEDREIIAKAREDRRVVITLDADFHTLLALSGAISPSVIRIRIERLKAVDITNLLLSILPKCEQDLAKGAVVTVDTKKIRFRYLPLLKFLP